MIHYSRSVIQMVVGALFLFSLASFYARADNLQERLNPKLSPEYVALLKTQALGRKIFFSEQANAKASLKLTHIKERQDLLMHHREERKKFTL